MGLRVGVRGNATNRIPADHEHRINSGMRDAIADSTRFGRTLTQANTPKRTGRTAGTVGAAILGGGAHVSGHFGSDDEIFGYLERGTRAHIIRGNPWLFWPGARHPVRQVNHPGTRALHTLEEAGEVAGEVAKEQLGDVFAGVFG